jgi:hypothetical protein
MSGIVKIKRFIQEGRMRIDSKVVDTADLAARAAEVIREYNLMAPFGTVVFEGENGQFYTLIIRAVIEQVHPDYVKRLENPDGQD